jgi:hypothetical protein
MRTITTKVTNQLHQAFQAQAQAEGVTPSMKVRELVENYLSSGVLKAQQEVLDMTTQQGGCVNCAQEYAAKKILERDLKDVSEERDYWESQARQIGQQRDHWQIEAQKYAQQLDKAHSGHHDIQSLMVCANCKPTSEQLKKAAQSRWPHLFEPTTVKF